MRPKRTVTTKERAPIPVLHIGAGRGTRLGLTAYEQFNASSPVGILPTFLDAEPGKALAVVEEARRRGITAQALEARVEDVLKELPTSGETGAVVVALDHGRPIAEVIEATPPSSYVLGSILIKIPFGPLYGLSFCLGPEELGHRQRVAELFRRIGTLTVRRGSRAVVGEDSDLEDRAGEPFLRSALAERTGEILRKVVARLRPTVSPLEITIDHGRTAMPVMVWEAETFSEPAKLADALLAHLPHPIMRAEPFAIIELVSNALRIHIARLRMDGRVTVESESNIDAAAMEREAAVEEAEARAAQALIRAERTTITPTSPVLTTD